MKIIANERAVRFINVLCDVYLKTTGIKGHQDVQELVEGLEQLTEDTTTLSQDKEAIAQKKQG